MLKKRSRLHPGALKLWLMALLLPLSLILAVCSWAGLRQQQLAARVVRLHVVANSDEEAAQRRKLAVRDAVEAQAAALVEGASSPAEAQALLAEGLQSLAETGAAALEAAGGSGTVTAELGRAWYPTKESGGYALPAGTYASLRIVIGAGEGRNWWCILFPGLDDEDAESAMADGLTGDDVNLITRSDAGYELRFYIIEWWGSFQGWLSR